MKLEAYHRSRQPHSSLFPLMFWDFAASWVPTVAADVAASQRGCSCGAVPGQSVDSLEDLCRVVHTDVLRELGNTMMLSNCLHKRRIPVPQIAKKLSRSGEPKRGPHEAGPRWMVFRHLND